jgi:hypothetical protein
MALEVRDVVDPSRGEIVDDDHLIAATEQEVREV